VKLNESYDEQIMLNYKAIRNSYHRGKRGPLELRYGKYDKWLLANHKQITIYVNLLSQKKYDARSKSYKPDYLRTTIVHKPSGKIVLQNISFENLKSELKKLVKRIYPLHAGDWKWYIKNLTFPSPNRQFFNYLRNRKKWLDILRRHRQGYINDYGYLEMGELIRFSRKGVYLQQDFRDTLKNIVNDTWYTYGSNYPALAKKFNDLDKSLMRVKKAAGKQRGLFENRDISCYFHKKYKNCQSFMNMGNWSRKKSWYQIC
jgi:hypothetical protein